MIRSAALFSSVVFGILGLVPAQTSSVSAEEFVYGGTIQRIADRCAQLGEGFVDLGDGLCGRVSRHVRVGNAAMNEWTNGGTTNAAMHTTGPSMVPGADVTQRLRVRGNLESASPFR